MKNKTLAMKKLEKKKDIALESAAAADRRSRALRVALRCHNGDDDNDWLSIITGKAF